MPRSHLLPPTALLCLAGLATGQAPTGFPSYAGMLADMNSAASNHPTICRFVDLTASYGQPLTQGGNSLYAVKISDNPDLEEDEPSMLIVAAHHGNEYGTPIVALDAMARLTQGYGTDPTITALVDEYEIWIAPCWNPDGYYTSRQNSNGIDLNRNYPFLWSTSCNTGIKGPSPASEVETQTMIAFSLDQRFTKVLDLHSSGRETLFGYRAQCGQHVFGSFLQAEATAISQASSYGGAIRGPSSNGEHYHWQLGRFSNYAFLTEIDSTQSPTRAGADAEATRVWPGTVFMLQRPIPVWGHVTDAATGLPLEADISYVENPFTLGEQNQSEPRHGRYHAFLPAGNHTLRFELTGYQPQEIPVTVSNISSLQLDVQLSPPGLRFDLPNGLPATVATAGGSTIRVDVNPWAQTPQAGTGRILIDSANGPQQLTMQQVAANSYLAELPGFVCGDNVQLRFAADDTSGTTWTSQLHAVPTATQTTIQTSNSFEVASGWTGGQPGDTATTGTWGRMDPVATAAQPEDDHTLAGTLCWVTDGRGGTIGQYDVDNGFTTLLSPSIDLTGLTRPGIRYWRWFVNNMGTATDDVFVVDISNDDGATWVNAETIGVNSPEAGGGWFQHSFLVGDILPPTATMRVRFVAADVGTGSIVEAAIDDFEVFEQICDGEVARGGHGCPDSSGQVLRIEQTGAARLGDAVTISLAAGTSAPALLVAGLDDATWNGLPLPQVLPGTGTPGCEISIQPDVVLGLLGSGSGFTQPVPAIAALVGTRVFWQAGLLDPALTTQLQIATSDRLRTILGL
jgi:hypothetical protein